MEKLYYYHLAISYCVYNIHDLEYKKEGIPQIVNLLAE